VTDVIVGGCYNTLWRSTQTKVEGIVPTAAWHWVRGRSVVNIPLGESIRTTLNVGFPSARGSVYGDLYIFFPILEEGSYFRALTHINE
jgi:hypothetical protein